MRGWLVCSKRLMSMNTSFACRFPFIQRLGDSFDVAMIFVDSFDIAMTIVLDVLILV